MKRTAKKPKQHSPTLAALATSKDALVAAWAKALAKGREVRSQSSERGGKW